MNPTERTLTITDALGNIHTVRIASAEVMEGFGEALAAQCKGGELIALKGDLGAGKTTLTKGIARGLGIAEDITSPTFVLMKVYAGNKKRGDSAPLSLCHIDAYRLSTWHDLEAIGADEYIGHPDTVTVIEWPEQAGVLEHCAPAWSIAIV